MCMDTSVLIKKWINYCIYHHSSWKCLWQCFQCMIHYKMVQIFSNLGDLAIYLHSSGNSWLPVRHQIIVIECQINRSEQTSRTFTRGLGMGSANERGVAMQCPCPEWSMICMKTHRFSFVKMSKPEWPVISPHKRPVTRKIFPFDDVIMLPDQAANFHGTLLSTTHLNEQPVPMCVCGTSGCNPFTCHGIRTLPGLPD